MANYPFQIPSGVNLVPEASGINQLGTTDNPFIRLYVNAVWLSGIDLASNLGAIYGFSSSSSSGILSSGDWTTFNNKQNQLGYTPLNSVLSGNITSSNSGLYSLATPSIPLGSIASTTGVFEFLSGYPTITLQSTIAPISSGNIALGLTENRLSGVFTNTINTATVAAQKFNQVPNGLVNGVNKVYTYTFIPYNNSLVTYVNGLRMIPSGVGSTGNDYVLSGLTQTFNNAIASGSTIISDYVYIV